MKVHLLYYTWRFVLLQPRAASCMCEGVNMYCEYQKVKVLHFTLHGKSYKIHQSNFVEGTTPNFIVINA